MASETTSTDKVTDGSALERTAVDRSRCWQQSRQNLLKNWI